MESNVNPTITTFINDAGQKIAYKNWNAIDKAKGILLIVHGLNAHSGYYHNFAQELVENDFGVYD